MPTPVIQLLLATGIAVAGPNALTGVEGADVGAFTGDVYILGSAAATEGSDVGAFAGTVADTVASGSLAATDGADAGAFAGSVITAGGTFVGVEGADVGAFMGVVVVRGSIAATEGSDVGAFTGALTATASGSLAATEGADVGEFEGHGPVPAFVAYMKKAADLTAVNLSSTVAIAWTAESLDTYGGHDNSTANTKYIVPSALNGKYGVFHAMIGVTATASGAAVSVAIRKGGTIDYVGCGGFTKNSGNMSGLGPLWCCTQPILLTTADEFEVYIHSSDTSTNIEAENSSFSLEIVG